MTDEAPVGVRADTARLKRLQGWMDPLFGNDDTVLRHRGGGDLEVYRELLRDDQVASCYGQRFLGVTAVETSIEPASESSADKAAADWLREQLDQLEWDDIVRQMLYGRHYGYAVGEMVYARDGTTVAIDGIKVRDQRRFKLRTDGRLVLVDDPARPEVMPERKFWLAVTGGENADQPYGRGLGHQLYWPTFFKRGGVRYWLTYLERYAQPTPAAKMPSGQIDDRKERERALAMLEAIQTDSGVLIPEHIEVELLEAQRQGSGDYDTLREAMDRAIAKTILGQTMTSEETGGNYKAEVHKAVRDEIIRADADLIDQSFRRGPLRWLCEWNFPGARPPKVYHDLEPEEDLNERAERDKKIVDMGYRPTEEYIADTYGQGFRPDDGGEQEAPEEPGGPETAFAEAHTGAAVDRADQQAMRLAAQAGAREYDGLLGQRVAELLEFLEATDDEETFRRRLAEMVAEDPPPQATDSIKRRNFGARLLGQFRKQRRKR